ncbi:hypothetical protein [Pedobacter duraquae]|uniref:Cytochrome P460 n=1 Tax=Pedobacter duraquae TaxID=425511 RepID=A0A4V3C3T3_9SPHI|nr:hypothetical protein [Pedobacter duraquae]TDO23288.1 hypothetical protein CLV32_2277 [Pedobacter duraquae]
MKTNMQLLLLPAILLMLSCRTKPDSDQSLNIKAAVPKAFSWNPEGFRVINTAFNRKAHTTSTLYGKYLPGKETRILLTWQQEEDSHWLGARIPGKFLSAERLEIQKPASGVTDTSYFRFQEGNSAVYKSAGTDKERIQYISTLQPAITP